MSSALKSTGTFQSIWQPQHLSLSLLLVLKKKNAILIKGFATYSMDLNYVCMLKSPGLTSRDSDLIDLGYFGVKGMGKRDSELDVHEVFR